MGIDEAVLQELQRSWEAKVARSRVANFGFSDEAYYDEDGEEQHNINMAAGGDNAQLQYPTPYAQGATASLPALAAGGIRQQLPQQQQQQPQMSQPQQSQLTQQQADSYNPSTLNANGQQQQQQYTLMQPNTTQAQQTKSTNANTQDIQLPGGGGGAAAANNSRPNIPQNDGSADADMTTEQIDAQIADMCKNADASSLSFTATSSAGNSIPLNALPDDVKVLMRDARDRAVKAGAIKPNTRIPQLDGEGDTGDDDINSDLDDSDDADDDADGGEEIEHIILCLYDKVTRTKNKWKCVLKDGIMLVNGRDYLFHRASGDFEW
ncbi:transcription factor IIA, alpha/beta subunit [Zychaea mexicana]|uniref:transcription factor IIA, alpha/beta subunit n=1 Tax=Zychaea mexicana TaxID=64656 RepID=UPI0022FE8E6E|nr:transcription factor IIA, alpha/beta subunit [Zychaea mexicana]KAI9498947.1 transcription factor IIA, alpha/beta subunit [Zychaea mexicana]